MAAQSHVHRWHLAWLKSLWSATLYTFACIYAFQDNQLYSDRFVYRCLLTGYTLYAWMLVILDGYERYASVVANDKHKTH
jgi:hypothetical protein